jgi:hypothetical protein
MPDPLRTSHDAERDRDPYDFGRFKSFDDAELDTLIRALATAEHGGVFLPIQEFASEDRKVRALAVKLAAEARRVQHDRELIREGNGTPEDDARVRVRDALADAGYIVPIGKPAGVYWKGKRAVRVDVTLPPPAVDFDAVVFVLKQLPWAVVVGSPLSGRIRVVVYPAP